MIAELYSIDHVMSNWYVSQLKPSKIVTSVSEKGGRMHECGGADLEEREGETEGSTG